MIYVNTYTCMKYMRAHTHTHTHTHKEKSWSTCTQRKKIWWVLTLPSSLFASCKETR